MLLCTLLMMYSVQFHFNFLLMYSYRMEVKKPSKVCMYVNVFTGNHGLLEFGACDRRQCVNVTITDDDVVEETEIVEATLERLSDTDDRIILAPAIAKVVVTDDDGESAY